MRCTGCDYALWNLHARTCPECGKAFKPSDFEFRPDSVKFCCPHCRQEYYGTDAKGHLLPRSFACVSCGRAVDMDEMVLLPAAGTPEEATLADALPWTARKRRLWPAWFKTAMMAMFQPARLGRLLPGDGGFAGAFTFGLIAQAVPIILSLGGIIIFLVVIALTAGGGPRGGGVAGPGLMAAGPIAISMIALLISVGVVLLIWALLAHAVLRVSGDCRGELAHTFSVFLYTGATSIITALPCMGVYLYPVSLIWWAVCAAIMLAVVHRVSWLRAAIAASLLPLLLLALGIGGTLYFSFVTMPRAMRAAQTAAQAAVAQQAASGAQAKTGAVTRAIFAKHAEGQPLRHAVEFIVTRSLFPIDLEVPEFGDAPGAGSVAGVILTDVRTLSEEAQQALIARAAAGVPASGVHRLGCFVFCERGVLGRGEEGSEDLWVVIACPPATAGAAPAPPAGLGGGMVAQSRLAPGTWLVGRADGGIETIEPDATAEALAEQNELRAQFGLPPIPDPSTVPQDPPESGEPGG